MCRIRYDGVGGLWSGVIPYLLSLSYEEFSQWIMSLLRARHPKLDKTDELVLRACLVGHGAVLTTPFLSLSSILRCQSDNPNLPDPQPLVDIISNLPWKSTMIQLSLISALCALNCKLLLVFAFLSGSPCQMLSSRISMLTTTIMMITVVTTAEELTIPSFKVYFSLTSFCVIVNIIWHYSWRLVSFMPITTAAISGLCILASIGAVQAAAYLEPQSSSYPMDSESVVMLSSSSMSHRTLQTSINDTRLVALEEAITELSYATDAIWVLICGTLIFFMQAGFASLEVGSVRVTSVQSILLKNVLDVAVGGLFWWGTGFAIAYSLNEPDHAFFGQGLLSWSAGSVSPTAGTYSTTTWFFHWAYSTTAATIVSGGVAERARIESYVIYSAIMVGAIYPLIVSWTWNPDGWLRTSFHSPYYDFAGSGIIHLTGGTGALVGAVVLGPRRGRFVEGVDQTEFEPHSLPLIALGTLFLWFGWFGFNMGSTHAMHTSAQALSAGLIAVNVSLAASAGGLATFLLRYLLLRYHKYDMRAVCNGILGGLVAITAPCSNVTPGGALIVGAVAGVCYQIASWSIRLLKIDDPVDAFPIHGICGIWGVLAVPLLDFSAGMGSMSFAPNVGAGYQFGIQLLAAVVIMAFVGASSLLVFGFFRIVDFFRLDVAPTVEHCSQQSSYDGAGHQLNRQGGEIAVAGMKSNENGFSAGMSWDSRAHDFDDLSST